jgi:hypothetical protein
MLVTKGLRDIGTPCRNLGQVALAYCALMLIHYQPLNAGQHENVRIIFDIKPDVENRQVFDWLEREDVCWGIEVPWYTTESAVRALRSKGWEILVHLHAHPETLKRHWEYKGKEVPDVDAVLQKHLRATGGQENKVNWLMFIEDDSCGVGHAQEVLRTKPKTHAQAKQLLDDHLRKAHSVASAYPGLSKWGMCGFATSTHAFASYGLDWLILERANDDVDDLQTGIAFARGAARQYGCNWGLDLSLWWGPIYGCIQNLPASFHKRHLYLGYFSGAKTFRIEGGDLFWDRTNNTLAGLADTIAQFAAFAERIAPDQPDVPVAVILPEDHGWMTPPYWRIANEAWNYSRIVYRPGDRGIDGFFASAFPASNFATQPFPFGNYEIDEPPASPFSLSCVTPRFAPNPEDVRKAFDPIPFGRYRDRDQARNVMNASSLDPSPYRPMGDSRWGDIFDVLTISANTNVLSCYKAVVLLGHIKLTADLKEKLTKYVLDGGIAVCAAGVVGPDDEEFTGLTIEPEFRVSRAWRWQNQPPVAEAFQYLPAETVNSSTTVLAQTVTDKLLVARHRLGKGSVFTCTIPWYEDPLGGLSRPAFKMMDHVIAPLQSLTIQGLPVEWISTHGSGRRTVLIANHSETSWNGQINIRNLSDNYRQCIELLSGREIPFLHDNMNKSIAVEIPAYDVGIFRWE